MTTMPAVSYNFREQNYCQLHEEQTGWSCDVSVWCKTMHHGTPGTRLADGASVTESRFLFRGKTLWEEVIHITPPANVTGDSDPTCAQQSTNKGRVKARTFSPTEGYEAPPHGVTGDHGAGPERPPMPGRMTRPSTSLLQWRQKSQEENQTDRHRPVATRPPLRDDGGHHAERGEAVPRAHQPGPQWWLLGSLSPLPGSAEEHLSLGCHCTPSGRPAFPPPPLGATRGGPCQQLKELEKAD
uniref:Uncharacterized protein n=1 Tax=Rangifer tarandus platyrhynchus TaxID=3082113 RepID=A0ACB0F9E1_RANTA|nr:unnamed protein product [Rangifer tarandus platyrhynchus]